MMTSKHIESTWEKNLHVSACNACGVSYLVSEEITPAPLCPNCLQETLTEVGSETSDALQIWKPEAIIPFNFNQDKLPSAYTSFISEIPFKSPDLEPSQLLQRTQQVYIPMWWVDADVKGRWSAEIGFEYEVLSHQTSYKGGKWLTHEVKEKRIRWEPRVGQLERHYDNVPASGLDNYKQSINQYLLTETRPYKPEILEQALIRLVDRYPDDVWPEAEAGFKARAAEECCQACQTAHLRDFTWQAEFDNPNWTLLLLPLYITYYQDSDKQEHWVYVNGQSGELVAEKRASLQIALQASLRYLAVAILLFIVGSFFLRVSNQNFGLLILLISIAIALFSPYALIRAWLFNRNHTNTRKVTHV